MLKGGFIILIFLLFIRPLISFAVIRFNFLPAITNKRTIKDLKKFVKNIERERQGDIAPEIAGKFYCTYPGTCEIMSLKLAKALKEKGFDCRVEERKSSQVYVHYFIVCTTNEGEQIIVDPTYLQNKDFMDPQPSPGAPYIFVGTLKELKELYGENLMPIYERPRPMPALRKAPCF